MTGDLSLLAQEAIATLAVAYAVLLIVCSLAGRR